MMPVSLQSRVAEITASLNSPQVKSSKPRESSEVLIRRMVEDTRKLKETEISGSSSSSSDS